MPEALPDAMPVAAVSLPLAGRGLVVGPLVVAAELSGDAAENGPSPADPIGPAVRLLLAFWDGDALGISPADPAVVPGVVGRADDPVAAFWDGDAPGISPAGPAAVPGAVGRADDPVPASAGLPKELSVLLPADNEGSLAGTRAAGVSLEPSADANPPSDAAVSLLGGIVDGCIGPRAESGLMASGNRSDGADSGAKVNGPGV